MSCAIRRFPSFERHLKSILKNYPNSAEEISKEIDSLPNNPEIGTVYPGFYPHQVRKIRIGLRSYRFSASEGLRLIFLYLPDKCLVAPLVIYKKGKHGTEQDTKKMILAALREIMADL